MMEKSESSQVVYDKNVIDFLAVAAELCHFLEGEAELPRSEWVERALKLLPLLYLKALLLPETKGMHDELPPTFVREEDYARVASRVAAVMGEEDTYLDVFVEDMKYSETPVSTRISENVADIYQDIRDFVSVYQFGLTEQMNDALYKCRENFGLYWGQKLVNVLRPLHALKCLSPENENDGADLSEDELWD